MKMKSTACCAIQEIDNLSSHLSPVDAMESFCKQNLSKGVTYGNWCSGNQDALYSYYLFTAAITRSAKPYGADFAAYIRENGLGEVWESPIRRNVAFHADHSNQVWIWMPNVKAVRKWWDERTAATTPSTTSIDPVVAPAGMQRIEYGVMAGVIPAHLAVEYYDEPEDEDEDYDPFDDDYDDYDEDEDS